jgi:hypothetical protein
VSKKSLGQIAYEAYCNVRKWKAFDGGKLPSWTLVIGDYKLAWEAAAIAIRKKIIEEKGDKENEQQQDLSAKQ